jgi:hypothetical protein
MSTVQIPQFPEVRHPLIAPLAQRSDTELLKLFKENADEGRYFTAILCRYAPIVYTLIWHSTRSAVQADYLFSLVWRHVFYELGGLELKSNPGDDPDVTLQNWLINVTAQSINQVALPPVEEIQYSLKAAPPPLWCYVEQALDQLPPRQRLMTIMAQTYHWSETRIAAYLQAEGETISAQEVQAGLQAAYQQLEASLPADLRQIYFDEPLSETQADLADGSLAELLGRS